MKGAKGLAVAVVLGVAGVAGAATPNNAQVQGDMQVCAKDIEQLCGDIQPGKGSVIGCLLRNSGRVSAACLERIDARRETFRRVQSACAEDVDRLCGQVEPGEGRLLRCLKSKAEELSEPCRASLQMVRGQAARR